MTKGLTNAVLTIVTSFLMLISSSLLATNIIQLNVQGFIGPAAKDYLIRGIQSAQASDIVLIRINSTSGLIVSTHDIVQAILNANAPVVTFVSPYGAEVAGAGTFILYASTVAAMADGARLGAGDPLLGAREGGRLLNDLEPYKPSTDEQKAMNSEYSYLLSLPLLRERHNLFEVLAQKNAMYMSSVDALQAKVINLIAVDEADLIKQLNGLYVFHKGKHVQLITTDAKIKTISPDWMIQVLSLITKPTTAYLLILFGLYGVIFELMRPRSYFLGIIGGVMALTGLYAMVVLPINLSGLGFILLGLALVMGEIASIHYGLLGILGTIAFVWGSKMLMNNDHQDFQIYNYTIWIMAALNWLVFLVLFWMVQGSKKTIPRPGITMLIGAYGRSISVINTQGQAIIHGEIWNVESRSPIEVDKTIKVLSVDKLKLEVEQATLM